MPPDTHDPPKQSRRAKKGAQPPTLAEFLHAATDLRDTALAMLQADGHHTPLVVAWTQDGRKELIGLGLPEGFPLSMGQVLTMLVRDRRLRCFVSISEAWMTRHEAASLEVPPSQSPEREQVLVIAAIHPDQKTMWCYPFAHEGGRTILGTPIDSTGMTLSGGIPEALNRGQP